MACETVIQEQIILSSRIFFEYLSVYSTVEEPLCITYQAAHSAS